MNVMNIFYLLFPTDGLQLTFFFSILFLSIITILRVRKHANASSWQENWENGTLGEDTEDDDIDSEHGSVLDLSQAVSTKYERYAEIMPGILLVLGLLGTFFGLGLALNEASSILSQAKTIGTDSAMTKMMSMMQELGTNFKTSIWGILGFLLFKFWISKNNFEDRRLKWTIKRMKIETNERRKKQIDLENKIYVSHKNDEDTRSNELRQLLTSLNTSLTETIISGVKIVTDLSSNTIVKQDSMIELLKSFNNEQKKQGTKFEEIDNNVVAGNKNIEKLNKSITKFLEQNDSNVTQMSQSAALMAEASEKISSSALKLDSSIKVFESKVSKVLDNLGTNLSKTIEGMDHKFNSNLEEVATKLSKATSSISESVIKMSKSINNTLEEVGSTITQAVNVQQKAFAIFETTSHTLNVNIQTMTGNLDKVMATISVGLSAVSDKRQEMAQASSSIKEALQFIEKNNEIWSSIKPTLIESKMINSKILDELIAANKLQETINRQMTTLNEKFRGKTR